MSVVLVTEVINVRSGGLFIRKGLFTLAEFSWQKTVTLLRKDYAKQFAVGLYYKTFYGRNLRIFVIS